MRLLHDGYGEGGMWCASRGATQTAAEGERSIGKRGSDEAIIRVSPVEQLSYFGSDKEHLLLNDWCDVGGSVGTSMAGGTYGREKLLCASELINASEAKALAG
ncbi:hypothetical protein CVS37_28570 [Burkholderia lata]|nr:hypothetical protein CVS37_28570 [Burkholderia lata]